MMRGFSIVEHRQHKCKHHELQVQKQPRDGNIFHRVRSGYIGLLDAKGLELLEQGDIFYCLVSRRTTNFVLSGPRAILVPRAEIPLGLLCPGLSSARSACRPLLVGSTSCSGVRQFSYIITQAKSLRAHTFRRYCYHERKSSQRGIAN